MSESAHPDPGTWTVRAIPPVASDVLAYIPVVNRPDLLDKAVLSVRSLWPSLIVIDQTQDGLAPDAHPWLREIAGVYRIPMRTLTFSQMMNWAQAEARERGVDYLVFMHSDAECLPGAVEAVLDRARNDPKAGIVLSNYDAFACFQMAAVRDVGCWDETFEWYVSDMDYYRRMALAGYTMPQIVGNLVLHQVSQTRQHGLGDLQSKRFKLYKKSGAGVSVRNNLRNRTTSKGPARWRKRSASFRYGYSTPPRRHRE